MKAAIIASTVVAVVGYFGAPKSELGWLYAIGNVAIFWLSYWVWRALDEAWVADKADKHAPSDMPKGDG